MCGRYSLFTPVPDLEWHFDATAEASFSPRYNAAPGQDLPVILDRDPDAITTARWGFTPSWADEDHGHINARAETATEKASFREAVREQRCLVPADGFYEWVDGQPYRVTVGDGAFAMAGIWDAWTPPDRQAGLGDFGDGESGTVAPDGERGPDGPETVLTYAVLTTEPNAVVGDLHHRMSAILAPEEERAWLDADPGTALDLLDPYPAEEMDAYPVSTAVNDPENDRPELIEPVEL
jgi:putative SOS response-associated peptidase YedK